MEPKDKQMDNRPWFERTPNEGPGSLNFYFPPSVTDKAGKKDDHEHDWNDGKHNTTCATCGAERPEDGAGGYHSDMQQDR